MGDYLALFPNVQFVSTAQQTKQAGFSRCSFFEEHHSRDFCALWGYMTMFCSCEVVGLCLFSFLPQTLL